MPDLNRVQDPPADRLIREVFDSGRHEALNEKLARVIRNHQVPALLEDPLFDGAFPGERRDGFLPEWTDPAKVRLGAEVFSQYGPSIYVILASASLPATYASEPIAAALHATGQLDSEVPKRLRETSQMVLGVTAENGFADQGAGIALTLRVRLLHATIRYLIQRDAGSEIPDDHRLAAFEEMSWDEGRLGKPIHQNALMLTLLTFSYLVLRGLRELGLTLSTAESEAYIHTWNVVGSVLGVADGQLPETYDEAEQLFERLLGDQLPGDAGDATRGRQLARALNDYIDDVLIFGTRSLPELITRRVLGAQIANQLDVDRHLFFGLPGRIAFLLIRLVNRLRMFTPLLSRLWGLLGRQIIEDLSLLPGHEQARIFELPWKLDRARAATRQRRRTTRRAKRLEAER